MLKILGLMITILVWAITMLFVVGSDAIFFVVMGSICWILYVAAMCVTGKEE